MSRDGLSSDQAAAALARFGPNDLAPARRGSRLLELLRMLADPMVILLAIAAAAYIALGDLRNGIILAIAIVPVIAVDAVLEARSRNALAKLAAAVAPPARVRRGGREIEIPAREVVPGDRLLLREGDVVHADARVEVAVNLAVDESPLTGESEPQSKAAAMEDDRSRVFAGSTVLTGQGETEVERTGTATRFGTVARLLSETPDPATPLQRRIRSFVGKLAAFAALVAVAVSVMAWLRGEGLGGAFLAGVSLAMAAAPEEFPLVFTLFLSLGAWRLGRKGVLVKRLAAVETLGSTTVVCLDKTGTLTLGHFGLETLVPLGRPEKELLETALLASEPDPADPMEQAIVVRAARSGVHRPALEREWAIARDHDFEVRGKHMSHVFRGPRGGRVVAKGALEGVLEHCAPDGATRGVAEAENERLAAAGMRVLAVAERFDVSPPDPAAGREADERDWTLVGLLAFRDPLRPEVPAAIAACRAAGIEVKLVTGDHLLTAVAIATAAGIPVGTPLEGRDLDGLDRDAMRDRVRAAGVLARVRPEQKHAVVEALRDGGEVVAMTGDGVNDAPALKRADIGISMGARATAVARASADLVLLQDSFAAFVATVREGRAIGANLAQAFLFLIAFHVPVIGLTLAAPLLGLPLVLLPVHLVWLELVIHPISALVFEGQSAAADSMTRPPRARDAPLLERRHVVRSAANGAFVTGAALVGDAIGLADGEAHGRAIAMAVLVFSAILLVIAERAYDRSWWEAGIPRSRRTWLVLGVVVASLPLALWLPGLSHALALTPLGAGDLGIAMALAIAATGWRAFLRPRSVVPAAPRKGRHAGELVEGAVAADPGENRDRREGEGDEAAARQEHQKKPRPDQGAQHALDASDVGPHGSS